MVSIWPDIYPDSWEVKLRMLLFSTTGKAGMASDKTFTAHSGNWSHGWRGNKYSKHKASAPIKRPSHRFLINFHALCQRLKVVLFGSHSDLKANIYLSGLLFKKKKVLNVKRKLHISTKAPPPHCES